MREWTTTINDWCDYGNISEPKRRGGNRGADPSGATRGKRDTWSLLRDDGDKASVSRILGSRFLSRYALRIMRSPLHG